MLLVILGLLVGAAAAWFVLRNQAAVLHERLRARETESARLAAELDAARNSASQLAADNSRLSAELSGERAAAGEKIRLLTEAHERLANEFKALSADALKHNNSAFLELARETFSKLQQQSLGDLEKRQLAIDSLVKPLKESLDKVDGRIGELEKNRAAAYGQLGQQLEQLNAAQLRLQTEAARLSTALRSTSYAGSWGELQLRRVVEMADMLPYCDFVEQETSGGLRADLVIRLPGGQRIVVDAKSPVQSYRDAADAPDETARSLKLAEHAARIRGHIDALGAKNYWEQFQPAPEFVVLFIPGDHFLNAALLADNTLLERALARKVLLATPTSLIALLKAAAYGWRQEAVSQNAEEISRLGRDLYDRVATFADHLEKVGKGLETAVKGYNSAVGSFEGSVLAGARRFAELGAKGAKDASLPSSVETGIRDVSKRA